MRETWSLALMLILVVGGSPARGHIFGKDDRVAVKEEQREYAPWRHVGRLSSGCTGTLVGPDLVLTAAHCVYQLPAKKRRTDLEWFALTVIGGRSTDSARVIGIITLEETENLKGPNDWAIIRLDEKLGNKYGWMEVDSKFVWNNKKAKINIVGYSTDIDSSWTMWRVLGCSIHKVDFTGNIFHDCDSTPGGSGGPIFVVLRDDADRVVEPKKVVKLVGVNYAVTPDPSGSRELVFPEFRIDRAGVGLTPDNFSDRLRDLLRTGQTRPATSGN